MRMSNEDIEARQQSIENDLEGKTEYRHPEARIAGEQILVLYDIALTLRGLDGKQEKREYHIGNTVLHACVEALRKFALEQHKNKLPNLAENTVANANYLENVVGMELDEIVKEA